MIYPFPEAPVREFAGKMDKIFIVESLDPYIENNVKMLGIKCEGKKFIPSTGELSTEIVRASLGGEKLPEPKKIDINIPMRPPMLCQGCPHGRVFEIIRGLDAVVTGDIGCYTLGALKPYEALDTCLCMGASVGAASGFEKAKKTLGSKRPVFAVIGDSTFVHSGITPLIEAVYNQSPIKLIILDNHITAMTGHQTHPGTGYTLRMEKTTRLDFVKLAEAVGVKDIHKINIFKKGNHEEVFKKALEYPGVSVIIVSSPCVLNKLSHQINREDWGGEE
jgi:indolepyruvate ferredoxin oxidoreductase alpha subunit